MKKPAVFMTGAGGGMGYESFKAMLPDIGKLYDLIILVRNSEKNHQLFDPHEGMPGLTIKYGDLLNHNDVDECIRLSDLCLHIAAFVSPQADYHPKKAMQNNYGSVRNLIESIHAQGKQDTYKFVYIGTVAETGDRMPPIHWGRVGDPIKPSMFDYYAVSKVVFCFCSPSIAPYTSNNGKSPRFFSNIARLRRCKAKYFTEYIIRSGVCQGGIKKFTKHFRRGDHRSSERLSLGRAPPKAVRGLRWAAGRSPLSRLAVTSPAERGRENGRAMLAPAIIPCLPRKHTLTPH